MIAAMIARLLVLLSLFLFGCSTGPKPRLSICAIFKDEAPWIKEWIVYHHHVLKAEHFYLYNNGSQDNYMEVLQPFINQGIVELFEWDSDNPAHFLEGPAMNIPWVGIQMGAYNDCLKKKALGKTDWVAMIDIDEFIVPVHGVDSFYALLNRAAKRGKGSVSLSWRMFGTSGVYDLQEGDLLVEKLVWRGKDDHPLNDHVKSIHRPEGVAFCAAHKAHKMEPGFRGKSFPAEQVRVHHYWMRTGRSCKEKRGLSPDLNPEVFEELHQVKDQAIGQYIPLLKKEMGFRQDFTN